MMYVLLDEDAIDGGVGAAIMDGAFEDGWLVMPGVDRPSPGPNMDPGVGFGVEDSAITTRRMFVFTGPWQISDKCTLVHSHSQAEACLLTSYKSVLLFALRMTSTLAACP